MAELKRRIAPRKTHVCFANNTNPRLDVRCTAHEVQILNELVAMSTYRNRAEYIRAAINAFAGKEVFNDD